MSKSIPVDVIRDMRNKISSMREYSRSLLEQAHENQIRAEEVTSAASSLENMADGWCHNFPDTEDTK